MKSACKADSAKAYKQLTFALLSPAASCFQLLLESITLDHKGLLAADDFRAGTLQLAHARCNLLQWDQLADCTNDLELP